MASNSKPKSYDCAEDDDFQEYCENFTFSDSVCNKTADLYFPFTNFI